MKMHLKASTDYGIRAILYLAAENDVRSSKEIAQQMSIPRDYLIQLAQLLRNAGLIEARPGKHGGYLLARDASEISLLEIIDATQSNSNKLVACPESLEDCDKDPEVCNQFYPEETQTGQGEESKKACMVRRSYSLIQESFRAYLSSLTVDVLLSCVLEEGKSREYLSQKLIEEGKRLAASAS